MAHQAGTANNPVDLLQKLIAFIAANGWTIDHNAVEGNGWRMHAHRSGVYINIRACMNEYAGVYFDLCSTSGSAFYGVALYCGDGYSSAVDWKAQSGAPKLAAYPTVTTGVAAPLPTGAISGYHFFANNNNDSIVVVVEKSAGVWTNFGWGVSLNKVGSWTGGAYFFAPLGRYYGAYNQTTVNYQGRGSSAMAPFTYQDSGIGALTASYVRADVDSFTGKWIGFSGATTDESGYTGKNGATTATYGVWPSNKAPSLIVVRATNALSGQSLLQPIHVTVQRDAGGSSFIGTVPGIFTTNACAKGFTPGATYQWGSSNYKVFPGPSTTNQQYGPAGCCGFAVKMD